MDRHFITIDGALVEVHDIPRCEPVAIVQLCDLRMALQHGVFECEPESELSDAVLRLWDALHGQDR